MAVVIVSEPHEFVTVRPWVEWIFLQNSPPASGFEKWIYYRISINGLYTSNVRKVMKYTGQNVELPYSDTIIRHLDSPLPNLTTKTALDESNMKAVCRLEYGEYEVDLSDGSQTDLGASLTPTVTVLRGGFNNDQEDIIDQGGDAPVILSNKPSVISVNKDQSDWIYLAANSGSSMAVRATFYNRQSVEIFAPDVAVFTSYTTVAFPMGGANFYDGWGANPISSAAFVILEVGTLTGFNNGASLSNISTYRINFIACEDLPEQEFYFREPKGGWSSLRFDKVEISTAREVSTYDQYYDKRAGLSTRVTKGSKAVTSASGIEIFTLSKKFTQEVISMQRYLSGILGTKDHYIRRKKEDGDYQAVRVILEGGTVPISTHGEPIEVKITCKLSEYINEI